MLLMIAQLTAPRGLPAKRDDRRVTAQRRIARSRQLLSIAASPMKQKRQNFLKWSST
jgi:hypothetical protein